jgi:predicted extracellular nuclease
VDDQDGGEPGGNIRVGFLFRGDQRYTYDFEGNSQTLDHILLCETLLDRRVADDVVHVNAEFATRASDHDPQVARITIRLSG